MTITKARMEEIDFSDVYYEAGQQVLVPENSPLKSIQDSAGEQVCALKLIRRFAFPAPVASLLRSFRRRRYTAHGVHASARASSRPG
jgi:ABC-type amino acid transport substrate-binding protein